ncbi:MAG TPA: ribosomal protein S18-alanine N-acetyltransferase [Burkholderiaceae bacterium]|nr:ribosomal protein S18-alanine N-acetyltransferase [Burkholderiaceae bacterium]
MSALWRDDADAVPAADAAGERRLVAMALEHLDAVMAIENAAYAFPWSRGNFVDSIVAAYPARVLLDARGALLGYFVAMAGVDEMHLLNITVAPAMQGRGHARHMMAALVALCGECAARELWLEVRLSNTRARAIYERFGFVEVGIRKGYYPAGFARREDAAVMTLKLVRDDDALE